MQKLGQNVRRTGGIVKVELLYATSVLHHLLTLIALGLQDGCSDFPTPLSRQYDLLRPQNRNLARQA